VAATLFDIQLPGFVAQQVAAGTLPTCFHVNNVNNIVLATDQV
jgi:hypothetical protein